MTEAYYDVIVIGAGVVGLGVARELSRRELSHAELSRRGVPHAEPPRREISVLVIDKEHDVGRGASGRNSGVVHPGFSVAPGTLKARLNVEGSRLLRTQCAELGVPLREVGTLVVASCEDETGALESMLAAGQANGLERLEIIGREGLRELEPGVAGRAALHCPEGAIVDSHVLVFRLADSCLAGGCRIALGCEVRGLARDGAGWVVSVGSTGSRVVSAQVVVNAAGVHAPEISKMAGGEEFDSFPCRGEYLILDRLATGVPGRMVYPVPPGSGGLGVHFTPTIAGNTLIGPSAEYIDDGDDFGTSGGVVSRLFEEASALCPGFDPKDVIAGFAGVRAKISQGAYGESDFVVEHSRLAPGLINLVGIESPGLSSSPAIARMAADLALERLDGRAERGDIDTAVERTPKGWTQDLAEGRTRFAELTDEEKAARAREDEDSRTVVCRCEQVTRAEILEALRNPLGAHSLSAVKTRCRAGMGRCQGGFCAPRVIGIMREELGMAADEITLKGPGSEMLVGEAKELLP